MDSLCHPRFTTANLPYRFPILKLPPPPLCGILLVVPFWTVVGDMSEMVLGVRKGANMMKDTVECKGMFLFPTVS